MKKYVSVAVLSAVVSAFIYAHAVPQKTSPGMEPFTPVRIDWLVTTLQANLRESRLDDKKFTLNITASDPETVDIYVRYLPTVDRRTMNLSIETARKLILIKSKSYGWDGWVKIKEDVEPADPTK
jgi:hypothetical protein